MRNYLRVSYYFADSLRRAKMSKNDLDEYQNKKIRKVIQYAYDSVPFYKRIFDEAGIKPSDIRTKTDLNKIPIISKSQMKSANEADLISRYYDTKNLKNLKTGGSTGIPFSFYISNKEDDWRQAIQLRPNYICGQKPWQRWVTIIDGEYARGITNYRKLIPFYPQTMVSAIWSREAQLKAVESLKPDVLDGFSSSLWLLAREVESRNITYVHPKLIFGTGELISPSSREYLEKVFGAPYYDQFGCMEVNRTAWECKAKIGYHMDVDSVIMQFVDKNGDEVAIGEEGEIVYTSLFNYAMPFIRYGIKDIGVPLGDVCPCGITLPLMKMVAGRSNSFLTFPDGNRVGPWVIIEHLKAFTLTKEIDQYRVIQKRKDLVEIYVKKSNEQVDEEKLSNFLTSNIRDGLQNLEKIDVSNVQFDVKFVNEFETTARGKQNVIQSIVE
jgi:phenylacetate-CoA ligase